MFSKHKHNKPITTAEVPVDTGFVFNDFEIGLIGEAFALKTDRERRRFRKDRFTDWFVSHRLTAGVANDKRDAAFVLPKGPTYHKTLHMFARNLELLMDNTHRLPADPDIDYEAKVNSLLERIHAEGMTSSAEIDAVLTTEDRVAEFSAQLESMPPAEIMAHFEGPSR
jgi:hypothetical protein